jgi:hypothetical protein
MTADTAPAVVPAPPVVEFAGRWFRCAVPGVSTFALLEFADVAKDGLSSESLEGMAALYELLRDCIDPADWPAFRAHARTSGASGESLMFVIRDAVAAVSGRPTQPPSASPGGRSTTVPSSAAGSSSPGSPIRQGDPRVQTDLEARGRPDLALVVKHAGEASTRFSAG